MSRLSKAKKFQEKFLVRTRTLGNVQARMNKKLIFGFAIALAIVLIFVGSVLALQSQEEMQNKLDNLVSDLNNSGYDWLVDYGVSSESQCVYVSSIEGIKYECLNKLNNCLKNDNNN